MKKTREWPMKPSISQRICWKKQPCGESSCWKPYLNTTIRWWRNSSKIQLQSQKEKFWMLCVLPLSTWKLFRWCVDLRLRIREYKPCWIWWWNWCHLLLIKVVQLERILTQVLNWSASQITKNLLRRWHLRSQPILSLVVCVSCVHIQANWMQAHTY